MLRKNLIAPLLAASAAALTVTPAYAGKADRAREAIAAAEAKIHTAETMGATTELPHEAADARAALALARENLSAGHKEDSIRDAIHAQQLADSAIGMMQRRQDQALAAERDAHSQDVAVAQQQAADAQAQAAQANIRASAAEQHAANSAAEANAARIAAQTAPEQVETTVTTGAGTARPAARHVTRKTTTTTRRAVAAPVTTTTTTVRQAVN